MRRGLALSVGAALLLGMTAPSIAQTQPATQNVVKVAPADDLNQIVCEKQEVIGSRLGTKRVCMTRAQWAERRLQDRQELERVQVQRGAKGE